LEDRSSIDGCIHSRGICSILKKKKVKNKAHVEASICEAYIVEEISTFILYYFEPHLRTRINRVPRHDDGAEVPSSGNLSIFSNPG
jgi:hypothetical protein